MWTVSVPIKVPVSSKKDFSLNLNLYRNAHHHTLNKAKVAFAEIVIPRLAHLPVMSRVRLSYHLFAGSNTLLDLPNVCSIVCKFFCDALVKAGKIPDDNYLHVVGTATGFGGVDKNDPRVEVFIECMD